MGGDQRKGIHVNIADATSHTDFVDNAMRGPSHLSGPAPLPPELADSVAFLRSHSDAEIRLLWRLQLKRHRALVRASKPLQAEWYPHNPPDCASSTGDVNIGGPRSSYGSVGHGGQRWRKQFAFGFDVAGTYSQSDLYPISKKKFAPPLDTDTIWPEVSVRFRARARASGFKHADRLWRESLSQHERGGFPHRCLWARAEHRPDSPMARWAMPSASRLYRRIKFAPATTSNTDALTRVMRGGHLSHSQLGTI